MIIYLQYTISDTRNLTDKKNELLDKPNWRNLTPFKDFVSGSGQVIERTKRGLNNWVGENNICKINKGFYNVPKLDILDKYQIKCIGKHQYSDGKFLHKYEFVFHLKNIEGYPFEIYSLNEYSFKDLNLIINEILNNEIKIRNISHKHDSSKIGKSFSKLKFFHINCTTKNKYMDSQDLGKIKICIPQVFLQFQHFDIFHDYPKKVLKANTPFQTSIHAPIEMFGWLEKKNNFPYRFWLLKEKTKGDFVTKESYRKIRISCLRLHSEIECIKKVLQSLSKIKERSLESDLIQSFLNDSTRNISKSKKQIQNYSGIDNIDSYIKQVFEELEPGVIFYELERLRFRKNINDKTKIFVNNHYGSGDIVGRDKYIKN